MPVRFHFLNVGHGDCTIIEHYPSGRLTMIDLNNSQQFDTDSRREFIERLRRRQLEEAFGGIGLGLAQQRYGGLNALALPATTGLGLANQRFAPGTLANVLAQMQQDDEEAARELTDPIAYMLENFPGRSLWRFILTHPDLDHMRGLKRLYETVGFSNFWDITHDKSIYEFRSSADREDWEFYQRLREGRLGIFVHRLYRGETGFAWNQEGNTAGDGIEILSPTPDVVAACLGTDEFNDASYVLRVHHAGRSIILPGDAGEAAFDDMVRAYGTMLKSDWLKGSHHGRDSGYHLGAVQLIEPRVVVTSVGCKPSTDAHSKYHYHCGNVRSTRYHGNILLDVYDNGQCKWWVDRNPDQ